jgi:hypothetical protein
VLIFAGRLSKLSRTFISFPFPESVFDLLLKSALIYQRLRTVPFVLFIGIRCINSHQKDEKISYDVGIDGFLILH